MQSFGTTDRRSAERQWSEVDRRFHNRIAFAKQRTLLIGSKDERRRVIWDAIAAFLYETATRNDARLPIPASIETPTVPAVTSHPFVFVRNQFLGWAKANSPDAYEVMSQLGDSRLGLELFHYGLVGSYFVVAALLDRVRNKPLRPNSTPIETRPTTPVIVQDGTTLDEVVAAWARETTPTEKHKADVKRSAKLFQEANPGVSVEATTRDHIARFRATLAEGESSANSRNRTLACVSTLYGFAKKKLLIIDNNGFAGVKFSADKANPDDRRTHFSDAQLKLWFSHRAFAEHDWVSYGCAEYWLPLLALYTGARQAELAQLDRGDVLFDEDTEIDYLRIAGTVGGESQKRVKTRVSRRYIPVHEALSRLGFLRFVQKIEAGRLFPMLRRSTETGSFYGVSKFSRQQLTAVGIADSRLVFHSLRHTFRTKARSSGVAEETVDYLVGHTSVNQGRAYGTHELAFLKSAIDQVRFPVDERTVKPWP